MFNWKKKDLTENVLSTDKKQEICKEESHAGKGFGYPKDICLDCNPEKDSSQPRNLNITLKLDD